MSGNQLDGQTLLSMIRKVVERYVQRKVIPQREFEDVTMTIVEKIYSRKEKIDNAFEGKSQLTTYYIAVINRMCCEVIRKECRQWYAVDESEQSSELNPPAQTPDNETEKNIILEQEMKRLEYLLLFLNNEKAKTVLFLKFYFDIPISPDDVRCYAEDESGEVLSLLKKNKIKLKEDIFICLAKVVNIVENKRIGKDAVRIWFTAQVNSLIERLNGKGFARHNRDSLGILLEMLYRRDNRH